ncbi:hypothetical protein [Brucella pseudogrignonensis]|uniref:Phosphoserine aminotransferase n=1 Tax=Brucella pseudogrignonensis TaxID=419475 RepID=A0ABU1MC45_9HYPH|nr:phosphoserine aminotransferase [Brucella pseudogrignonensis]
MHSHEIQKIIQIAENATRNGPPSRPGNPYFGVGPITDGTDGILASQQLNFEFGRWLTANYRKYDDRGRDLGGFTIAEIEQSMHRGYPADKIILDMMREIHSYFGFSEKNRLAVGLGGGHSGFTSCIMHLMNTSPDCQVYVDTPAPEGDDAAGAGFFRQSWAAQIIEMQRHAKDGDVSRLHFAASEGAIPDTAWLKSRRIRLFIGVGHETTGATSYSAADIRNLCDWLDADPHNHHAILDATSLLGAMAWEPSLIKAVMEKCCLFTPLQKAIGGIAGYFVASFTPHALALIGRNQQTLSWFIPRQLRLTAPLDPKRPLSSQSSVEIGPFYDPASDKMLGGVINTFSVLAFARTTFGLMRVKSRIGNVEALNLASIRNRDVIANWTKTSTLLSLSVSDVERRGAAVTLLSVNDADITDPETHARILAKAKSLLGYEGITHASGRHEAGLCAAFYINAFPGTPGDFRAWVGGVRSEEDVLLLLENLQYAWQRAKIVVLQSDNDSTVTATDITGHIRRELDISISSDHAEQLLELRKNAEDIAALSVAMLACRADEYPELVKELTAHLRRLSCSAAAVNPILARA